MLVFLNLFWSNLNFWVNLIDNVMVNAKKQNSIESNPQIINAWSIYASEQPIPEYDQLE